MTAARPSCLAVIPARGGSKGVPKKNIQQLAGKPLIAYTIEAAKRSKHLERVIVSTDDPEIAEVARQAGAEVVMRPPKLATDEAPTELALLHVVETLKADEGYAADIVVTLEPTSPLRTHDLIDRCIERLRHSGADSLVTVVETRECLGTLQDGRFTYLEKDQPRRRQDRKPLYRESGTVYATRTKTLLGGRQILGGRVCAVVVEEEEAVDINTPLDFVIAGAILQWKQGGVPHDSVRSHR